MDWSYFIAIALVMIAGGALQSAAGFGFGMLAIPLLIVLGTAPHDAITILSVTGLAQTLYGVHQLRRHVVWSQIAWMVALAGVAVPLGVLALHAISSHVERTTVRQIFGTIVLAAVLVQWTARVRPRAHLHWLWGVAAMLGAGFMAGLAGMGAPPAVLWVMAHDWSNRRSRVTFWALFTGLTPLQWFFLHQQFGDSIIRAMGTGALLVPVALIGVVPGVWIGHRIPKSRLRQASFAIIALVAIYAIVSPYL